MPFLLQPGSNRLASLTSESHTWKVSHVKETETEAELKERKIKT